MKKDYSDIFGCIGTFLFGLGVAISACFKSGLSIAFSLVLITVSTFFFYLTIREENTDER